jgi:hypothetical protein
VFVTPEMAGFLLIACFSGLIYFIGTTNESNITALKAQINGVLIEFWAVGVATILISFALLFYLISLRIIERLKNKIRSINSYYIIFKFCT